jgi:retron-type reverse transcriptase
LKCDIKRFFDNIDHRILKDILAGYIQDKGVLRLLSQIIDSFRKENPPP